MALLMAMWPFSGENERFLEQILSKKKFQLHFNIFANGIKAMILWNLKGAICFNGFLRIKEALSTLTVIVSHKRLLVMTLHLFPIISTVAHLLPLCCHDCPFIVDMLS